MQEWKPKDMEILYPSGAELMEVMQFTASYNAKGARVPVITSWGQLKALRVRSRHEGQLCVVTREVCVPPKLAESHVAFKITVPLGGGVWRDVDFTILPCTTFEIWSSGPDAVELQFDVLRLGDPRFADVVMNRDRYRELFGRHVGDGKDGRDEDNSN